MKVVLASISPRREELLKTLIKDFEIIPSSFDESIVKEVERNPSKLVKSLSLEKAKDVFEKIKEKYDDLIVIGGDTIVYFNKEILGKPKNEEDSIKTLGKLQGKSNEVYTGLAVIVKNKNKVIEEVVSNKALVYMKKMNKEDILEYIKTKEPLDKAGSYAVQGIGEKYIEKIEGNYYIAVGMDIDNLKKILTKYCIIK